MSNEIIEEFSIGSFFKKVGNTLNKAVVQPINKAVIKPINNVIIKPVVEGVKEKIIEPVVEGVKEKIIEPIKDKIIDPIKDAIDPDEPSDVVYDDVKPEDLYEKPPLPYNGPAVSDPQFNTVKLSKVTIDKDDIINAMNDPTIPSENKNTNINIDRYNTKTIEYLDTDIYYKNNRDKYTIKDKIPKTNKYIKYFIITIFLVLGILVCIEFSKNPKERWNILVVYIILVIFIKFFYNINKRFLFFNSVDNIDKIFDKNKKSTIKKILRIR